MSSSHKITAALALATAAFVSAPVATVPTARADTRRRVENGTTPLWWIEHKLAEISGTGGAGLNGIRRRVDKALGDTGARVNTALGALQETAKEARRTTSESFQSAVTEVGSRTSLPGLSQAPAN